MRHLPNLSFLSLQGPTVPTGGKQPRKAAPKKGTLGNAPGSSGEDDDESEDLFGSDSDKEASSESDSPLANRLKKKPSQVKSQKKSNEPVVGTSGPNKSKQPQSGKTTPPKGKKTPGAAQEAAAPAKLAKMKAEMEKKAAAEAARLAKKRKEAEAAAAEAATAKQAKKAEEDAPYAKAMAAQAEEADKPDHATDLVEAGRREPCCGHR